MSRLIELITELCPEGVEYKTLGEVIDYKQPTKYIVESTNYNDDFTIPVLTAGDSFILGYTDETKGVYPASKQSPVIIFDDFTTSFHWVDFGFKVKSSAMKLLTIKDESQAILRYLFFAMKCISFEPSQHARHWIQTYSNFSVPVPPLPVQQEIVRILDKFTTLEAKLEAELEARKIQYEYYRDSCLTFGDDVERKILGKIATDMYRGSGIKRDQVTESGTPCVRYGEIYTTYNIWFDTCISHTDVKTVPSKKYFEHGDILFAITGESVDEIAKSCVYIGHEKCLAGGDVVVMKHNENPKYLGYALSTPDAQRQKSKGKVKSKVVHSSVPALKAIEVPIPSLVEQERIVAILDRFDALVNDITQGLPAEITARRKQYEYYRGKLLSFKEKVL